VSRPFRFATAILIAGVVNVALCAAQSAPAPKPVWVNLGSGVYHCPGTEHYGTTSQGEYLPETTAMAKGYHANGGRLCSPEPAGASKPVLKPLAYAGPPAPAGGLTDCLVVRVVDGDTFDCKKQGRIRPIGIDAPELKQKPFGVEAATVLATLIPVGITVRLSPDVTRRDRNGRMLAYVWLDGTSVNWIMIRQGYATTLRYPPDTLFAQWFDQAKAKARSEQLGLWPIGGFDCLPYDYRHNNC